MECHCHLCPSVRVKDCAREQPGSHHSWFEEVEAGEAGKPRLFFFSYVSVCLFSSEKHKSLV